MTIEEKIVKAAQLLLNAESNKVPCEPIRNIIGETDIESAYEVQNYISNTKKAQGAKVIGKKIGLTNPIVQNQLGVNQPDFGMLWNNKEVLNGGTVSIKEIMQPKVEAELAFVLNSDLNNADLTSIDVINAIEYVLPCIEIVGSRIKNWDIKISDTIADNASASHWVIGHKPTKLENIDLVNCKMTLSKNKEIATTGFGYNCLGSPINATLWLARKLQQIGNPLRTGDLILTGSLGPMIDVIGGDYINVEIEGAGSLSVNFNK